LKYSDKAEARRSAKFSKPRRPVMQLGQAAYFGTMKLLRCNLRR
jgi:hypothetical protein